jgi:hypothetical protein
MTAVKIPLTRGKCATVDHEDAERLLPYKWYHFAGSVGREYAATSIGGRRNRVTIYMHRFILDAPKGMQVDHRDGDGLNNTRANLRLCTGAQNVANQR